MKSLSLSLGRAAPGTIAATREGFDRAILLEGEVEQQPTARLAGDRAPCGRKAPGKQGIDCARVARAIEGDNLNASPESLARALPPQQTPLLGEHSSPIMRYCRLPHEGRFIL